MNSSTSQEKIWGHLQTIVGDRYPFSPGSKLNDVSDYLCDEMKNYGLKVHQDPFAFEGKTFSNIVGELAGEKDSVFIVGAHFDAVENSPGADDNASGVAVLLEAARIMSRGKWRPTLRFVAFNLEEFGMIGSSHYAKIMKHSKAKLSGMVSLEMVGYTDTRPGSQQVPPGLQGRYSDTGNFIGLVANGRSKKMLQTFQAQMSEIPNLPVESLTVPLNGWFLPATRLSDHSPFWDAGFPALLITDTSFFRNPHYHLPADTLETLDLNFLGLVSEGVIRAVQTFVSS